MEYVYGFLAVAAVIAIAYSISKNRKAGGSVDRKLPPNDRR